MVITVSQQSTFRRYAAKVLSPFFIFVLFDVSLVITPLIGVINYGFYRAMHFSAKRGIAIACRLSVCLSVCL